VGVAEWTVPGYSHVRELGRNGDGRTVLATHSATGMLVAIRYLADDLSRDEARLVDCRESARLAADLESANIAGLYEYVESGDGVAMVREYVDGASLRQVLPASGLGMAAAFSVLRAGLLGLVGAHARGLTHRGYKPENVLVDAAGGAKLADFAIVAAGSTPAEDVSAALATFVDCVNGSRTKPARLPHEMKRLAEAGDASEVLAELDGTARATAGTDWDAKGRKDLARRVSRSRRRRPESLPSAHRSRRG
jgi:eukaryotic-like serine/threonine-protein kinase